MTTRTVTTDLRQYQTFPCCYAPFGLYHQKSQTGGSDPKKKAVLPYHMYDTLDINPIIEYAHSWENPKVWYPAPYNAVLGGVAAPSLTWDSNDDIKLLNRLGEKIKDHSFNAAVSIGAEGKEALEQVASKTMEVVRGFRDLRKGNIQGALREFGLSPKHAKKVGLHKDLSGRVLATQLGWIPLLSDIQSASEAFHALTSTPKSQSYVASLRKRGDTTADGEIVGEAIRSRRLHWTLSEELTWNESLGLSNPWDFADAVWNATTLSFIADWFIPIGGYLEARSLATTLKGSGYYTEFYKYYGHGKSSNALLRGSEAKFTSYTEVHRVLLSRLDGLVALPSWKNLNSVPSWKRALTAVSLATQMFL